MFGIEEHLTVGICRVCFCSYAGFQTHTTPILMGAGERAELGTEKYLALSSILEGVVILKPNPDYVEVQE